MKIIDALRFSILSFALAGCAGSPAAISSKEDLSEESAKNLCNAYAFGNWQDKRLVEEVYRRGDISEKDYKSLLKGEISTGMSELAGICAYGLPSSINTTAGTFGTQKQYVYNDYNGIPRRFLYFRDGVLTSWQY